MCEIVEIRVLALGNADSIIVVLRRQVSHFVMLIDTGRNHHLTTILDELRPVLQRYGKQAPDLVVCTHYDFDHIGSLTGIVARYRLFIQHVWMHKTSKLIDIVDRLATLEDRAGMFLPDEDAQTLQLEGNGVVDYSDDDIQWALQQLKHEVEALAALEDMGINPVEPIASHCQIDEWPEIEVIGPTYDYYQKLFPKHFDFSAFLEKEKAELTATTESTAGEIPEEEAFERLDMVERANLTPTNLNSAIIMIETAQGKFLFTGDAGIESFEQIPDYKNKLKDIHFLKVPHHGSANNLNSELIQLMNPDIAFIPGGSHVSKEVVAALKKQKTNVHITQKDGPSLVYPLP